jgi:hypothetical protein
MKTERPGMIRPKRQFLSDSFPMNGLIQRHALSPLVFSFHLEYGMKKSQENEKKLKFNGRYKLPAFPLLIMLICSVKTYI